MGTASLLQGVLRRLPGGGRAPGAGARSISSMVSGTVLGQAVTVLAAPILTRLYGPPDFGAFAVYTGLLSLLSSVVCLRYDFAITVAASEDEAVNVVALSALCALLLSGLSAVAVGLFAGDVARIAGAPSLSVYLWLLPLCLLGLGLTNALSFWAVRRSQYRSYARCIVTSGLGQSGVQLGAGALGAVPAGLFLGDLASRWVGAGTLAVSTWREQRQAFAAVSGRAVVQVARRYKRFPLLGSWGAVLSQVALEAPVLLLAASYAAHVTGSFSLVQRLFALPMVLIGRAVGMYYVGEGGQRLRTSPGALRVFFRRTALRLALFAGLPLALAGLLGPWLIPLVFGAAWVEAGWYALALSGMAAIQLVVVPVSQTLNLLERQDLQLAWDVGRTVLIVASLGAATALGLTPLVTIAVYAAAMAIAYLVLLALAARVLRAASGGPGAADPAAAPGAAEPGVRSAP
jgi:O-antigen/teichoic acid export membrane protein